MAVEVIGSLVFVENASGTVHLRPEYADKTIVLHKTKTGQVGVAEGSALIKAHAHTPTWLENQHYNTNVNDPVFKRFPNNP